MQNANMRNRSLIKLGISLIPQGVILVSNRITRHHGNADIKVFTRIPQTKANI